MTARTMQPVHQFLKHLAYAFILCATLLSTLTASAEVEFNEWGEPIIDPITWVDMNYGQALMYTVQVDKGNIAYKGLSVRLDKGEGGVSKGSAFMIFDTDTLRWAAGWTGKGFIDWRSIGLDATHGTHPSLVGKRVFTNPVAPGWARPTDNSWVDERVLGRDDLRYGPLDKNWGHWNGHYYYGDQVVLSYTIGDTEILEMPGVIGADSKAVMTRTLNIAPHAQDLFMRIADSKSTVSINEGIATFRTPANNHDVFASLLGTSADAELITAHDGKSVVLKLSSNDKPLHIKVLIGDGGGLEKFTALSADDTLSAEDLQPLTSGGETQWVEKLTMQGTIGEDDGAYAIDTINHPVENPYKSRMRFSGFAFFEDDSRMAVCTWDGDVWLVEGIDDSLAALTWQRIASGMFQPLGMAIVDEEIYVLGRDQITILRDFNGDGETDFYENFNNDHQVTEHFHEFALDLKLGVDGDFYYTKGGRHAKDSITPQHGTLIRVSRDGKTSERVANGFRAPNGLGLGPNGEMMVSDNEGHWMPANRLNWVKPGGFYGYMWGYIEGETHTGYDEPLAWIHPSVDRSPGTCVWVEDERWGPLKGKIITVSYGMGQIFNVMHEEVNGLEQGGVVRFPLDFKTGVTRAEFRKSDGQLYLAGLYGWAGNKIQPGGFYRVRYTGKPLYMPEQLNIAADGVVIKFTDPLDTESALNPGNYAIKHWNYIWRKNYGSPDLKLDGTEGRDTLQASQVILSADRRTVHLKIPGIQPVMQMDIQVNIKAEDGTEVRHQVHHTIHNLGAKPVDDLVGSDSIQGEVVAINTIVHKQGLQQTLNTETGAQDVRHSRLAAVHVEEGTPISSFLDAGSFTSTWTGFINVELNETYRFSAEGMGTANLKINGKRARLGHDADLKQGLNSFNLLYTAPETGDATFRLYWESKSMNREPVPATALVMPEITDYLKAMQVKRSGRVLVAEHRCMSCHEPGQAFTATSMPELSSTAPSLDGIGKRLNENWMTKWLHNPSGLRSDTTMPHLLQSSQEAADIAAYLTTDKEQPSSSTVATNASNGKTLYNDLGCIACHSFEEKPGAATLISHANIANKWNVKALSEYLQHPEAMYADTRMPNFSLTTEESSALAAFLMEESSAKTKPLPKTSGNPDQGKRLLASRGCINCHSLEGMSSTLSAPTLSEIKQTSLIEGCLSFTNAHRGSAPDFRFTTEELSEIREFIFDDRDALNRFSPAEYAERQFTQLNCLACHARDGVGDHWTNMMPESGLDENEEEATIHTGRPHLDFAGEKLRSSWMTQLFAGTLPGKTRPGLAARMPAFASRADNLVLGLAAQHGFAPLDAPTIAIDTDLIDIGRDLAMGDISLRCNTCHPVGDQLNLAGKDTESINFAEIPGRLRKSYFHRFTVDPQRTMPGTQMPNYTNPDGTSILNRRLDGDIDAQYNAIWQFMRTLPAPDTSKQQEN